MRGMMYCVGVSVGVGCEVSVLVGAGMLVLTGNPSERVLSKKREMRTRELSVFVRQCFCVSEAGCTGGECV